MLTGITHFTDRFKLRRMVPGQLPRNNNPDSHYSNAIYSFMKEKAARNSESTAIISADAKYKVSNGELDFPIAAATRSKAVICS